VQPKSHAHDAVGSARLSYANSRPVRLLVFELENLAVENGRKRVFDSAKQALAGSGSALAPAVFCRIGTEVPPSSFISVALQELRVRTSSQQKVKTSFDANCRKAFCEKPALRERLPAILARARQRGIRAVAISFLDAQMAADLMKATGLADMGVELAVGKGWTVHPYQQNVVNQVLDRLRVNPGTCLALMSSGAGAEAALCAGTRVLAVPDAFTSFQSFSGADEVLDTWRPEVLESVLSLDGEGHR
jgi:beta-phosphoglucomutase-like phosphatase (HAD superfamily)